MADRFLADPRPDLGDGGRYARLLALGYLLDGHDPAGLFGALLGLRCWGARVVAGERGGGRLVRGEIPGTDYDALRARYLLPHAGELRRLLALLAEPGPRPKETRP